MVIFFESNRVFRALWILCSTTA